MEPSQLKKHVLCISLDFDNCGSLLVKPINPERIPEIDHDAHAAAAGFFLDHLKKQMAKYGSEKTVLFCGSNRQNSWFERQINFTNWKNNSQILK